ITSGSGAQREIIDDGESGFIVDPLNEHTLQQAMEYVMSDDVNLPNIITKARHVVEERFIVNRVTHELVTIIDNLHSTNH
ncbi:MAG: glycosyltransferase, partial [Veillonella nakazawae]